MLSRRGRFDGNYTVFHEIGPALLSSRATNPSRPVSLHRVSVLKSLVGVIEREVRIAKVAGLIPASPERRFVEALQREIADVLFDHPELETLLHQRLQKAAKQDVLGQIGRAHV